MKGDQIYIGNKGGKESKNLGKCLHKYLNENQIDRLANKTGSVKRKNPGEKPNGSTFLRSLILQHEKCEGVSLLDLSRPYFENCGKTVSKQAIHQRFTDKAVAFSRLLPTDLLETMPRAKLGTRMEAGGLSSIKIKDATPFRLPPGHSGTYPGPGGPGPSAMIEIQYGYDLPSGKITHLSPYPFVCQDSTHARETLDEIEQGDLILRDLGYYFTGMLPVIGSQGAYYLGKLPPGTNIFTYNDQNTEYQKIAFSKLIDRLPAEGKQPGVFLTDKKVKSRPVIRQVPKQVYDQRARERKARPKKGNTLSKEARARLWSNLYITNLAGPALSVESIHEIYRPRWQVGLVFKTWKPYGGPASIKQMKQTRSETTPYIRLIWPVVQSSIMRCVQNIYEHGHKTGVSTMKLNEHPNKAEMRAKVVKAVLSGWKPIVLPVEKLLEMCPFHFALEAKKGNSSSAEIIKDHVQGIL